MATIRDLMHKVHDVAEILTPEELQRACEDFDTSSHKICFTDDQWIIQHPISERWGRDTLFKCEYIWPHGDPGLRGVYAWDGEDSLFDARTGEHVWTRPRQEGMFDREESDEA